MSQDLRAIRKLTHSEDCAQQVGRSVVPGASALSVLNHEVRTPLNAILGFSEIMARELLGPHTRADYRQYARHINESGRRLLEITDALFALASIETGLHKLTCGAVDLAGVVDEACQSLQDDASRAGVGLQWPAAAPQVLAAADRDAAKEVLTHVIGNAIKFSRAKGSVTVQTNRQDGMALVEVIDDGIGMTADFVEKATQPFAQEAPHMIRDNGGVGLGLTIAKSLIERMNGSLSIFSRSGAGTRVTLTFKADGCPQIGCT